MGKMLAELDALFDAAENASLSRARGKAARDEVARVKRQPMYRLRYGSRDYFKALLAEMDAGGESKCLTREMAVWLMPQAEPTPEHGE